MADTLLFNGRIATLDPAHASATAAAIDGGLMVAWYDLRQRYAMLAGERDGSGLPRA